MENDDEEVENSTTRLIDAWATSVDESKSQMQPGAGSSWGPGSHATTRGDESKARRLFSGFVARLGCSLGRYRHAQSGRGAPRPLGSWPVTTVRGRGLTCCDYFRLCCSHLWTPSVADQHRHALGICILHPTTPRAELRGRRMGVRPRQKFINQEDSAFKCLFQSGMRQPNETTERNGALKSLQVLRTVDCRSNPPTN